MEILRKILRDIQGIVTDILRTSGSGHPKGRERRARGVRGESKCKEGLGRL